MGCLIKRFIISLRLDSGKPLFSWMEQHINSCHSCRSLIIVDKNLLDHAHPELDSETREFLKNRVLETINSKKIKNRVSKRKNLLIPVYAAAAALFLIALSFIFLYRGGDISPDKTRSSVITAITNPLEIDNKLNSILAKVESPMQKEAENLKSSIVSVKQYFTKVLDFNLGI
ncbi:MAG: hypothetical protein ABFR75_06090 [Acidobacteriota bacterium]